MANRLILISSGGVFSSALMNHLSSALAMDYSICVSPDDFPRENDSYVVLIDYQSVRSVSSPWFEFFSPYDQGIKILLLDYPEHETLEVVSSISNICGVFFSSDSLDVLEKGIRKVIEGEMWFGRQLVGELLQLYKRKVGEGKTTKKVKISPREVEVLRCLSVGYSNSDVAQKLHLSENTVKSHLFNIFRKLNVKNRTQAVSWFNSHYNA
ncbi:LuxR C-terminal-related transcriptional regulator [Celerinatantimonas yamalensis]|uniref:LuxR C-terminal-related transcriptional regulator n=1 Tax=Celerinatantimonas yamalensis TaxID=559956 RepID=A0ABW9G9P2_9GAMM